MRPQYLAHWTAHRLAYPIGWLGNKLRWKLRYDYQAPFPQEGPVLVLSNHTSVFDPVWVAYGGWRPMHYMASAQLFRIPFLRELITALGAFPKAKFTRDRQANSTLEQLYEDGRSIVIFPEGSRTWDGRPQPVRRGIGRMVKKLDARVVTTRILTGHLHRPRWATHHRDVPVEVEYDAPRTFPDAMSADEITAAITEALTIDVDGIRAPAGSSGERLAKGLPDYLWACPRCFTLESLEVDPSDRDVIACEACSAGWRVTVSHDLIGVRDGAPDTRLHRAARDIEEHVGSPPVADRERFEREELVLESPAMTVHTVPRGQRTDHRVAEGRARLYPDRLKCHAPSGDGWSLPLDEVKAVSLEIENALQVRTADALFQLDPAGESNIKWGHFLNAWNRKARGKPL